MLKAAQVLARFKAMSELDQCKKMMDMEGFLNKHIDKLKEQLHKAQRKPKWCYTNRVIYASPTGGR